MGNHWHKIRGHNLRKLIRCQYLGIFARLQMFKSIIDEMLSHSTLIFSSLFQMARISPRNGDTSIYRLSYQAFIPCKDLDGTFVQILRDMLTKLKYVHIGISCLSENKYIKLVYFILSVITISFSTSASKIIHNKHSKTKQLLVKQKLIDAVI